MYGYDYSRSRDTLGGREEDIAPTTALDQRHDYSRFRVDGCPYL